MPVYHLLCMLNTSWMSSCSPHSRPAPTTGTWNGTTAVAIKIMKKGTMIPLSFIEEAQLMKRLRHENLVSLYAVCAKEEPIYIVTELMINGSLLDYLRTGPGKDMDVTTMLGVAAQVSARTATRRRWEAYTGTPLPGAATWPYA